MALSKRSLCDDDSQRFSRTLCRNQLERFTGCWSLTGGLKHDCGRHRRSSRAIASGLESGAGRPLFHFCWQLHLLSHLLSPHLSCYFSTGERRGGLREVPSAGLDALSNQIATYSVDSLSGRGSAAFEFSTNIVCL